MYSSPAKSFLEQEQTHRDLIRRSFPREGLSDVRKIDAGLAPEPQTLGYSFVPIHDLGMRAPHQNECTNCGTKKGGPVATLSTGFVHLPTNYRMISGGL